MTQITQMGKALSVKSEKSVVNLKSRKIHVS
jgi:hypothetical protein